MSSPSATQASFEPIPTEAYAMIYEQHGGPIQYKKLPVREPGAGEVLVKMLYSGVCHTDLHAWKGGWPIPSKLPLVGGHEGVGRVVKTGEAVTQVKAGDLVGIKWINGSCLTCEFCLSALEQLCPKVSLSGYTVDGTFQQYTIGQAAHVTPIPEECEKSLPYLAPILCAGVTVYRALKESSATPGQTIAITGAGGGLGTLACQYAKAMGLEIIAIDTGSTKRDLCLTELGCKAFIDFKASPDIRKEVLAASDGLGPHACLVLASSTEPFEEAAGYVRPNGTVVAVGLPQGAKMSADLFSSVTKMIKMKGSYVGNREDAIEAVEFYRRGKVHAPVHVMPLTKLPEIYQMMEDNQITGRIVVSCQV